MIYQQIIHEQKMSSLRRPLDILKIIIMSINQMELQLIQKEIVLI